MWLYNHCHQSFCDSVAHVRKGCDYYVHEHQMWRHEEVAHLCYCIRAEIIKRLSGVTCQRKQQIFANYAC